jgi:MtfA peptidase
VFGFFKRRRRRKLQAKPFPPAWLALLEQNVRFYADLVDADRRELLELVRIFMAEKSFEGCGGLELTDLIKVTITAQACRLLLHRETDLYPRLITILVYPTAYVAKTVEPIGGPIALEGEEIRLGEAWKGGVVIVSWDEAHAASRGQTYGRNVVLHEFAHQLDMENGNADGVPVLKSRGDYVRWAQVMKREYERLRRDSALGRYSALDDYGATNPSEFFAVATECFFEKAGVLRKRNPELYDELNSFYRQDPAQLVSANQPLPA